MCNVCTGVQETKEGRSSNESLFREEDHEMRAISSKSKSSAINIIYSLPYLDYLHASCALRGVSVFHILHESLQQHKAAMMIPAAHFHHWIIMKRRPTVLLRRGIV